VGFLYLMGRGGELEGWWRCMVYKYNMEANVMSVVEADYLYKHVGGRAGDWDMDVVDGSVVNLILIFVPNFIGARGCLPSWVPDVGR